MTAKPLEDVSAITFMAERLVAEHPVIATWNAGSPAAVPFESLAKRNGVYQPRRRHEARVVLSDPAGIQRLAPRACGSIIPIRCS